MHLLKQHTPASQAAHVASHRSRGPPACSGLPSRTRTSTVVALGGAPGARPTSPIPTRVTAQVEACRCSRHLSLDAHAAYLDCSSLLAQVHACGGREAQATSLLVGNVASALKVRDHASACAPRAAASPSIRAFRLNPIGTVCAPGARRAIGGDEGQSDGHAGEPWRLDLRAPYHGVTTTTATQATDSRESQMCVALHEPCTYIEVIVFDSRA